MKFDMDCHSSKYACGICISVRRPAVRRLPASPRSACYDTVVGAYIVVLIRETIFHLREV